MRTDFFAHSKEVPVQDEFYIFDEQNQTPVKLLLDSHGIEHGYIVVNNDLHLSVGFIPVDNKIKFYRDDGTEDNVCDALVFTDRRVTFIEIKDVKGRWKAVAKKQVEATIAYYNLSYPEEKRRKQAYLCNVAKEFSPCGIVTASNKEEKETFFKKFRTRLFVGNIVFI